MITGDRLPGEDIDCDNYGCPYCQATTEDVRVLDAHITLIHQEDIDEKARQLASMGETRVGTEFTAYSTLEENKDLNIDEVFFDLHTRGCKLGDVEANKWCNLFKDECKSELYSLIMDVIGEDEKLFTGSVLESQRIRNELKAELRLKLKEYCSSITL